MGVRGSGFRVFWVWGLGVQGLGFRVWGLGFEFLGLGFRNAQSLGFRRLGLGHSQPLKMKGLCNAAKGFYQSSFV